MTIHIPVELLVYGFGLLIGGIIFVGGWVFGYERGVKDTQDRFFKKE